METYPTLRPGAYTALLEEYAEAVLFLAFAQEQKVATLDEVRCTFLSTGRFLGVNASLCLPACLSGLL